MTDKLITDLAIATPGAMEKKFIPPSSGAMGSNWNRRLLVVRNSVRFFVFIFLETVAFSCRRSVTSF